MWRASWNKIRSLQISSIIAAVLKFSVRYNGLTGLSGTPLVLGAGSPKIMLIISVMKAARCSENACVVSCEQDEAANLRRSTRIRKTMGVIRSDPARLPLQYLFSLFLISSMCSEISDSQVFHLNLIKKVK